MQDPLDKLKDFSRTLWIVRADVRDQNSSRLDVRNYFFIRVVKVSCFIQERQTFSSHRGSETFP